MATVKAPNKEYAGVSAGVLFANGVGHTDDPYLLKWFHEHGYEVEVKEPAAEKKERPAKRGK